ncbi:MAG: hypothetical protein OXI24_16120 [Candidatus Poribacteria bacterium]|nr:hypothetical protein [Candidatus Poribacteria bacterium]
MGISGRAISKRREYVSPITNDVFKFSASYRGNFIGQLLDTDQLTFGNIIALPSLQQSDDGISLEKSNDQFYIIRSLKTLCAINLYYTGENSMPANTTRLSGQVNFGISHTDDSEVIFEDVGPGGSALFLRGEVITSFPIRAYSYASERTGFAGTQLPNYLAGYAPTVNQAITNVQNHRFGPDPYATISFVPPDRALGVGQGLIQVPGNENKQYIIVPQEIMYCVIDVPLVRSADGDLNYPSNTFQIYSYIDGLFSNTYENLIPYLSI